MTTSITTSNVALPVIFEAPAVPPQGFGLVAAATKFDTGPIPRELIAGIDIYPYNCDTGFGSVSPQFCQDSPAEKEPGERGALLHADPLLVWSAAECRPDQTEATELARARQIRALNEPLIVESAFADRILTDAGSPEAAGTFLEAVGAAEAYLGELGYTGFIHASRRFAATAAYYNLLQGSAIYRTPLGNTWVFGGGYESVLGDVLVVTGQVFMWRSDPFEEVKTVGSHPTPKFNNTVYAMTERLITVGYECVAHAFAVSS